MSEQVQQLSLEKIIPHPDNRRVGGFDPVKLQQLADSIKEVGVQQPIIVRKQLMNGDFELVAGERRWRAAKLAGLAEIPTIVRELDDLQVLKIQTIENLQREDVHPLDEADGFARLIDKAGYDIEQIAKEVGKSASYIYQRLKLLDLVPEARDLFVKDKITAGHAILIARLAPKQQQEILKNGITNRWGDGSIIPVRDLDSWIHRSILMELSKACWKLDDETLVPSAGSCKLCPKRAGFQPALFADVSKDGKKDYCTDRACFSKKQTALLNQLREQLKDVPHLEVEKGWSGGGKPKGALGSYDWNECKKDDRGAKKVLIVAGEGIGRMTYGKVRGNGNSHALPQISAAKEKAQREKEEQKHKLNAAFRCIIYGKTVEAVAKQRDLDIELLRLVVLDLAEHGEGSYELAKIEQWERGAMVEKRIRGMDRKGLFVMLVKMTIAGDIETRYWGRKGELLMAAAKICRVDLKDARKAASALLKAQEKQKDPEYIDVLEEASE
jgi:ParB/RepB/Spo0J family partition protein